MAGVNRQYWGDLRNLLSGSRNTGKYQRGKVGDLSSLQREHLFQADTNLEYSSELAKIYHAKDLSELTTEQRQVWIGFIFKTFTNMEANYLQHRAGAMDDDVFDAKMQGSVIAMMCNPLWSHTWQINSDFDPMGLTPEFRRYLDSRLASAKSEIPADILPCA